MALSFLLNFIAPITIPSTSSVTRTPKTVPPTKPPMVAAGADRSGVSSGWTNDVFPPVTECSRFSGSIRYTFVQQTEYIIRIQLYGTLRTSGN